MQQRSPAEIKPGTLRLHGLPLRPLDDGDAPYSRFFKVYNLESHPCNNRLLDCVCLCSLIISFYIVFLGLSEAQPPDAQSHNFDFISLNLCSY